MDMIIMGTATAVGFFIFVLKLPLTFRQRLLGVDVLLDIAATMAMILAFAGTYVGMAAAMVGGIVFSILISTLKYMGGYQTLHRGRWIYHGGAKRAPGHNVRPEDLI